MATDTGKHSALRQTDDGSFEIVYEPSGLQEVSEDAPGLSQAFDADVTSRRAPISRRSIVIVAVGAVAALATVLVLGFLLMDEGGSRATAGGELPTVPGFKPYGGGAEGSAAQARRPQPRSRIAAATDPEVEEEVEEPIEEAAVVEEAEAAGWEVQEPAAQPEVVEEEVVEEEVVTEGEGELPEGVRFGRGLVRPPTGLARPELMPRPNLPQIQNGSIAPDQLQALPLRRLNAAPGEEGTEEIPAEEVVEEELPAEELPAEEVVDGEEIPAEEGPY